MITEGITLIVHLTAEIHFNAKRVNVVGCLPSLAASAAVKVLCRSKCVWGSVRLSPARLQTVSPLGSVALLPDPDPQPDSSSAHQLGH